jgi:hypothetical protein
MAKQGDGQAEGSERGSGDGEIKAAPSALLQVVGFVQQYPPSRYIPCRRYFQIYP